MNLCILFYKITYTTLKEYIQEMMNQEPTESQMEESISDYIDYMHETVNDYLAGKITLNDDDWSVKQIIRGIDAIFATKKHLLHWKEPLILYVGIEDTIDNVQQYIGAQPAYTKATLDEYLAAEYARSPMSFILRLSLKTDEVPVIKMETYDMSEVLIDRNVYFHIVDIYPVGHELNPTQRNIVDCKVSRE